jgi:hypothetical protein
MVRDILCVHGIPVRRILTPDEKSMGGYYSPPELSGEGRKHLNDFFGIL